MQRNFVAWYLNGSRGGVQKDSALVAFVSPDGNDWRFSLVKMDYRFEQGKVKEDFTPARRWSFLVGKNENSHTAQSRLVNILANDEQSPTLTELEQAFDIETVTKEFFIKYRDLFIRAKEALNKVVKNNAIVRTDFEAKDVNTVDFAKKLLGQIIFLYFLQKKGWFGVGRDAEWGTGSKHFLRELFDKKYGQYENFFNDVLEHLFYDALRNNHDYNDYYYGRFNCKIPFLNGGLFDPIGNYDWVHADICLPDSLFSNTVKTREGDIGDGILDIFDRYNFTVKEDEPLEKEVAIDPELLGKAYEKFNAIRPDNFDEYKKVLKSGKKGEESKFNKQYGVYYTPREIVYYMCQQSLINYLATEMESKVKKEAVEFLILEGEKYIEYLKVAKLKKERNADYKGDYKEYPYFIELKKSASEIDYALSNIKICDPAVGSGAFPVGMMTEIIKARMFFVETDCLEKTYINSHNEKLERNSYNFKRECIEKCLYGVDIDPGAVEIAKLRLWLSLIVDEENIENIKSLPNLDYKIVCGNSLLGVEKNLFNNQLFDELEQLKPLYFNETNPTQKEEYKIDIDNLIKQITNGHTEFDFEVYFSEIFHHKGGFDIVITNPPYVSYGLRGGQKMSESGKKQLKETFPYSAEYKISLYAIFMDKAIRIAKHDNGVQTFIVPDSFLLGRYFSKIRNLILRNNEIGSILLLPYGVFEATVGFSVVYCFQRKTSIDNKHLISARIAEENEQISRAGYKHFSYPQSYFERTKYNRFRLFFDKKTMNLVNKIESGNHELGTIIKFSSGLIGKKGQEKIINKKMLSKNWRPGIISGSEIKKYVIKPDGMFLLYDKNEIKSGYESVDYFSEKLFMRQTGDSLICAYDNSGLLALNNIHVGNTNNPKYDLKFVASVINSKPINWYYKAISLEVGRVMAQTDIETIESLPIKETSKNDQKPFIEIVDKILAITKSSDCLENPAKKEKIKEYEKQIDQMVYKLYGLTNEEIDIIEGNKK